MDLFSRCQSKSEPALYGHGSWKRSSPSCFRDIYTSCILDPKRMPGKKKHTPCCHAPPEECTFLFFCKLMQVSRTACTTVPLKPLKVPFTALVKLCPNKPPENTRNVPKNRKKKNSEYSSSPDHIPLIEIWVTGKMHASRPNYGQRDWHTLSVRMPINSHHDDNSSWAILRN